jgi:hypothetical protein
MKINLLDKRACSRELQKTDAFMVCLNEYTLKHLIKKASVNEYLVSLANSGEDFSEVQKHFVERAFFDIIAPTWAELGLPEITVNIAVTDGSDMGNSGLPYTRGNTIFFDKRVLETKYVETEDFVQLLAHECFHVLSRMNPSIKNKMYNFFGFTLAKDMDIGIVNPDCPVSNYAIEINGVKYIPWMEMPTTRSLSNHILMYDLEKGESVKAVDTEIFELIGKTTKYVSHPEEICADFFMQLFVTDSWADLEKLDNFKEELVKCLK